MNIYVFPMLSISFTLMYGSVFAEIDGSISQFIQQTQVISARMNTEQIAIGHNSNEEIRLKTPKNNLINFSLANFENNRDFIKLFEIQNSHQLFYDVNVNTKVKVDVENGTDGTQKITNSQIFAYRKITYGKVVAGVCEYGFVMVQMRFRQDQTQSALVDHIVEPSATSRCLFVFHSIKPLVGHAVALARDNDNNFGVVYILRR